jgi:hypothetical protein
MGKKRGPTWEPSERDVANVLAAQNPWHESGDVAEVLARPVERPLGQLLWRRILDDEPRRFQVILGPRRVGKTTAMYQTVKHLLAEGIASQRIWWYRLDHPLLMQRRLDSLVQAAIDGAAATPTTPAFLFLDELTYAEDWDLWLKTFYDDHWPVRILGSSSSTAALRHRRHSGVGRWKSNTSPHTCSANSCP